MKKLGKLNRTRRLTSSFIDWLIALFLSEKIIFLIRVFFKNEHVVGILGLFTAIPALVFLLRKKDTYFPSQYRSLGKKIMGLYIVDENGKMVRDKSLIEQKNKITLTLSGWAFYIYRVLFFNESEAEDKLKIYVISKENLN